MTKNGYYSCPPDGFFLSHPSEQYSFYLKFKEIATPSQLVEFTDHKSPAVRVYAFKALESIKHDSLFEIAKRHIHETAWIQETCCYY